MAVRNLHAIQQQGRIIAEERENARNAKYEYFWARVNKILTTRNDAIDCIDTINALYKNGLRSKFEEWMKGRSIRYYGDHFYYHCSCPCGESAKIEYFPEKNYLQFAWNGYGMFSSYTTCSQGGVDRLLTYELQEKGYDEGLTRFADLLQIFLNNFFEWVEKL